MRNGLWLVAVVALLGSGAVMAQDQTQRPGGERDTRPQAAQGAGDRDDQNKSRGGAQQSQRAARPAPRKATRHAPARGAHRFLSQGRYRPSIHAPAFRYPPGYAYQRWTDGGILPRIFLSQSYYYGDYAALGLAPPPGGYQWVRYGPDLLLVSIATGRIADVVDGAFY